MGNPSALPTSTRQPVVVYRVDLALLARVHAAHSQSAEHAAAMAGGGSRRGSGYRQRVSDEQGAQHEPVRDC